MNFKKIENFIETSRIFQKNKKIKKVLENTRKICKKFKYPKNIKNGPGRFIQTLQNDKK